MEHRETIESGRTEPGLKQKESGARIRRLLALLLLLLLLLFGLLLAYLARFGDFRPFDHMPVRHLFSIYGLERPLYVSTDARGDLYVSDTGNARLLVYNSRGRYLRKIQGRKKSDRFYGVIGSYYDEQSGKLYVADFRLRVINVYDREGRRRGRFPDNPANKSFGDLGFSPFAIAMYKGNLYVTSNDGIYVFSPKGKLIKRYAGRGSEFGQWDYPVSIAIGRGGVIFVADQLNRRVVAMDQKGTVRWVLGKGDVQGRAKSFFGLPRGLALDSRGRLFVSDSFHHDIVVLTVDGKLLGAIGGRGVEDTKLNFPEAITFRPDGALYVVDRENDRIQAWRVNKISKPSADMRKRYKSFIYYPKAKSKTLGESG